MTKQHLAQFLQHIEDSAKAVDEWPEWKRSPVYSDNQKSTHDDTAEQRGAELQRLAEEHHDLNSSATCWAPDGCNRDCFKAGFLKALSLLSSAGKAEIAQKLIDSDPEISGLRAKIEEARQVMGVPKIYVGNEDPT